ncbi:VOC family protein [Virgibacillus halophilus]|uniref:VOC family protein n=1 Tax=Tigheibacillus halophilus TaxID=361280 RepID=A0ABU5C730_9BACI|nr:VOC family protein [Virgibacillus halophilus]
MEKQFFARPAVYVGEVHIKVKHMERAIHFYRSVLGFRVMKQDHHEVVLTADGRTPLLTLHEPQGVAEKENRTTGLYHFAILLPNRSDFAAFFAAYTAVWPATRSG